MEKRVLQMMYDIRNMDKIWGGGKGREGGRKEGIPGKGRG
jgi:hypothetical protein